MDNVWRKIYSEHTRGKNKRVLAKALGYPVEYGRTRYPGLYRSIRKYGNEPNWVYNMNRNVPIAYKNTGWTHYNNSRTPVVFFNGTDFFTINKKSGRRKLKTNNSPSSMNRFTARKPNQTWKGYLNRAHKYTKNVKGEYKRGELLQNIHTSIYNNRKLNKFTLSQLVYYMTEHPYATMSRMYKHYYRDPEKGWVRVSNRKKIIKNNVIRNIKALR